MRPWGVNAVRSLAPLECLTHLETLEVDGSASNAALSIVWPRLPALTRFRIASHSDVEQHDLAVFARAFPALTDLGHVCLSATHIDINLPAVVPHLRALACRLVARPSGLRAIAPLPPRIERLEVRITVKDDFDVSLAPGQLIMPLFALRAYPLLAVLHLRIGYVGPRAPSSYDPFALLYALPTLRHLEIVRVGARAGGACARAARSAGPGRVVAHRSRGAFFVRRADAGASALGLATAFTRHRVSLPRGAHRVACRAFSAPREPAHCRGRVRPRTFHGARHRTH
jgi:hypothetical protein